MPNNLSGGEEYYPYEILGSCFNLLLKQLVFDTIFNL
jgi:hypothetical protein